MAWTECTVEECNRQRYRRQPYCSMHYQRVQTHGNPHKVSRQYRIGVGSTQAERFWSLIDIPDDPMRCWEWQSNLYATGYGLYNFQGKTQRAHRIMWYLIHNKWPEQFLLHSCDNKICVNPNHLREGTQKENITDAMQRNRLAKGEQHGQAKLTEKDVLEIRSEYQKGVRQKQLAKQYQINQSQVSAIVRRKRWSHI